MWRRDRGLFARSVVTLLALTASGCSADEPESSVVRVATFNASMARDQAGALRADLERGDHPQLRQVAEILQRVRPDVVLLNEFDYDAADPDRNPRLFQERYLAVGQGGAEPIDYRYRFVAEVNTGVPSGEDLDGDGTKGSGGGDAFGFGLHSGQYGMVLLSRFPIDVPAVRTFRSLLWRDMPGALLPDDPTTDAPGDFLDAAALAVFRLSSKSLWDVPVRIGDRVVHVLASHPTPPAFDGPEDRNGRRNHDEIRLLADYISSVDYLVDDLGVRGGLPDAASFIILGDLNADPNDGGTVDHAVRQLLQHPAVHGDLAPASDGAVEATERDGGVNASHLGPARQDTADFSERGPGNLRVDYALPSRDLEVGATGVYWPRRDDAQAALATASDHRLVWVDIVFD